MVTPEARREAVAHAKQKFGLSERQACELMEISRSVLRYRPRPDRNAALREKLKTLAKKRSRWGCPLLIKALKRDGWKVNHKRVERLYSEEGLALRRKRRGRRIVRVRKEVEQAIEPNQRWGMDFIHDALWNGRKLRCLTIIDCGTRYCPAIEADFSLPAQKVIAVLNRLAHARGLPKLITVDNGPEFISDALAIWAEKHGVELDFIEPGKPMQNGHAESFNGIFRHECLDANWFTSLMDAKLRIEAWRNEYNTERPHGSLEDRTPEEVEVDYFNKEIRLAGTNSELDLKKG